MTSGSTTEKKELLGTNNSWLCLLHEVTEYLDLRSVSNLSKACRMFNEIVGVSSYRVTRATSWPGYFEEMHQWRVQKVVELDGLGQEPRYQAHYNLPEGFAKIILNGYPELVGWNKRELGLDAQFWHQLSRKQQEDIEEGLEGEHSLETYCHWHYSDRPLSVIYLLLIDAPNNKYNVMQEGQSIERLLNSGKIGLEILKEMTRRMVLVNPRNESLRSLFDLIPIQNHREVMENCCKWTKEEEHHREQGFRLAILVIWIVYNQNSTIDIEWMKKRIEDYIQGRIKDSDSPNMADYELVSALLGGIGFHERFCVRSNSYSLKKMYGIKKERVWCIQQADLLLNLFFCKGQRSIPSHYEFMVGNSLINSILSFPHQGSADALQQQFMRFMALKTQVEHYELILGAISKFISAGTSTISHSMMSWACQQFNMLFTRFCQEDPSKVSGSLPSFLNDLILMSDDGSPIRQWSMDLLEKAQPVVGLVSNTMKMFYAQELIMMLIKNPSNQRYVQLTDFFFSHSIKDLKGKPVSMKHWGNVINLLLKLIELEIEEGWARQNIDKLMKTAKRDWDKHWTDACLAFFNWIGYTVRPASDIEWSLNHSESLMKEFLERQSEHKQEEICFPLDDVLQWIVNWTKPEKKQQGMMDHQEAIQKEKWCWDHLNLCFEVVEAGAPVSEDIHLYLKKLNESRELHQQSSESSS